MRMMVPIMLALAPLVLESIIAMRIWRKRLYREYPVFCWFVGFDILRSLADFVLWQLGEPVYAVFFYVYWVGDAISIVFAFGVVWEVFQVSLRDYEGLRDMMGILFRWALVVLLLVAVVLALSEHGQNRDAVFQAIIVLQRSTRIVQAGLLLLLVCFGSQLAIAWRHTVFGITLGFAVYAIVQLVIFSVRVDAGATGDLVLRLLSPASYLLATLIWTAYLWRSEPRPALQPLPAGSDLARWNTASMEVLQR